MSAFDCSTRFIADGGTKHSLLGNESGSMAQHCYEKVKEKSMWGSNCPIFANDSWTGKGVNAASGVTHTEK